MSVIRSQCKDEAEYLQALRDEFAAKAMQAFVGLDHMANADVVKESYAIADAMLAERAK